jgi:hypothetical protein
MTLLEVLEQEELAVVAVEVEQLTLEEEKPEAVEL